MLVTKFLFHPGIAPISQTFSLWPQTEVWSSWRCESRGKNCHLFFLWKMGISPNSIAISREAWAVCGIATGFASSVSPSQWTTLSTSSEPKPPQGNHFSRWGIRPVLFAPLVLLGGEKCRVWHRIGCLSRARSKSRGRDYKLSVNTIIIVAHQLLLLPAIQLLRQTLFKRWEKSTQQPFF